MARSGQFEPGHDGRGTSTHTRVGTIPTAQGPDSSPSWPAPDVPAGDILDVRSDTSLTVLTPSKSAHRVRPDGPALHPRDRTTTRLRRHRCLSTGARPGSSPGAAPPPVGGREPIRRAVSADTSCGRSFPFRPSGGRYRQRPFPGGTVRTISRSRPGMRTSAARRGGQGWPKPAGEATASRREASLTAPSPAPD
jgi:hypothetical protein